MRDVSRYHRLVSAARRRLAGAISSMALLIAVVGVTPAWATESVILDQDRVLYGEEGSTRQLAEVTIDETRIGATCTLRVHTENQFSVHPGNDLLITTGGDQAVIGDVEAEPDADRDLSAAIVLGPVLVVELRFGPDQVSSMGFDLSVDCPDVAGVVVTPPTTCPEPASAPAATPTTPPVTVPADGADGCEDTTPISEVPVPAAVPTPTPPPPCATTASATGGGDSSGNAQDSAGGNLTIGQDGCPSTTVAAPPTTAPAVTTPPTTAAAQAPATTAPTPTVLGLQITRGLPQTPAAAPVQGSPSYTG